MAAMGARPFDDLLKILRGTSRSFYLTLQVSPRGVRRQLAVSYLFCRAADTIADTELLPASRRRALLALYRSQFEREEPDQGAALALAAELTGTSGLTGARSIPEERELLEALDACFQAYRAFDEQDRLLIRRLVTTLTRGMEMDLDSFSAGAAAPEEPRALPDDEALDRYCYHVAGCVGEFWTDLAILHLPALARWERGSMAELGVRFGKGLQMTNVLRDLPRDLRQGRCYVPAPRLEASGLKPADLRGGGRPGSLLPSALFPIIEDLLDLTLDHYRAGWKYTLAIPRTAPRLRLACAWPLLIGLETLALLRRRPEELLAGASLKISRPHVRGILLASAMRVLSDRALDRLYLRLETPALRGAAARTPALTVR